MKALKEALVNKGNIKSISKPDFYIVFPVGGDERRIPANIPDAIKAYSGWHFLILTQSQMCDAVGKPKVEDYISTLNENTVVWKSRLNIDEILKILKSVNRYDYRDLYIDLNDKFELVKPEGYNKIIKK